MPISAEIVRQENAARLSQREIVLKLITMPGYGYHQFSGFEFEELAPRVELTVDFNIDRMAVLQLLAENGWTVDQEVPGVVGTPGLIAAYFGLDSENVEAAHARYEAKQQKA
jgi:hypothetical protein